MLRHARRSRARWAHGVAPIVTAALALGLGAPAQAKRNERFAVEIQIIEARAAPRFSVDPALRGIKRDLKALPFKRFDQVDHHRKVLAAGEELSFQFPGPGPKRFLVVTAHGRQAGGKIRFQMEIKALRFDTLVAVPDGGKVIVGGPKKGDATLVFLVTARGVTPADARRPPPKRPR